MFKLIRLLINIAISVIVVLAVLYFLPQNLKEKILNIVGSIITRPAEQPQELIEKLEANFTELQNKAASDPTVKKVIEESQKILNDLKATLEK